MPKKSGKKRKRSRRQHNQQDGNEKHQNEESIQSQRAAVSKNINNNNCRSRQRASSSLAHLKLLWVVCFALAILTIASSKINTSYNGGTSSSSDNDNVVMVDNFTIPKELTQPMTAYPNPIGITEDMRKKFHPVVILPKVWVDDSNCKDKGLVHKTTKKGSSQRKLISNYTVVDHTASRAIDQLATEEQREARRIVVETKRRPWKNIMKTLVERDTSKYAVGIGKYDENRINMYKSDHFDDISNSIDGYSGSRTVHIGIDIGAPVGTKVYAFTDGIIHSAGYNKELGDYGNVIVVEHHLVGVDAVKGDNGKSTVRKVWALYGHLDAKSILGKKKGKQIRKGEVLGRLGDIHENGGWLNPHVHFQLSTHAPAGHDMPGAVTLEDRTKALIDYPDPRLVLGPLY